MSLPVPRHLFAILVAAIATTAMIVPATPQVALARDGSTFVQLVNAKRNLHGVGPVGLHSVVDRISAERADQMAKAGTLAHDLEYVKNGLAQAGVCWERLGEIIAYNTVSDVQARIERFVEQWYTSTKGHRELMLNAAYSHAGGSWTTSSNGRHYAAMVFIKLCGATLEPAAGGFTDIGDSQFRDDILWLSAEGITTGCSATKFCPKREVRRGEMATFLRRAMSLPAEKKDWFADDDGNVHESSINRIADARITTGCATRKFCPKRDVTRAQMAAFLVRALGLPPTARDYFRDDDGSVHEDAINRLAAAGITTGCSPGRFCPKANVTREAMAAFMRRAFD